MGDSSIGRASNYWGFESLSPYNLLKNMIDPIEDLFKQNEDLLLKIDSLVGLGKIDELIELGESLLIESHPSLKMSYIIYRHSWDCPNTLIDSLTNKMNEQAK